MSNSGGEGASPTERVVAAAAAPPPDSAPAAPSSDSATNPDLAVPFRIPTQKVLEPSEVEQYTLRLPERITGEELDIIKLTSQFIAWNGKLRIEITVEPPGSKSDEEGAAAVGEWAWHPNCKWDEIKKDKGNRPDPDPDSSFIEPFGGRGLDLGSDGIPGRIPIMTPWQSMAPPKTSSSHVPHLTASAIASRATIWVHYFPMRGRDGRVVIGYK
ncbi:hypothetical protein COCNU_09G006250 [Cocos nucifera]|uniref:Uncharacterized protein n=1 Tax=Cocos nucifera TaxID=13894 RepID=A0A8K0IJV2_COCNU|nr:hypothetical protein COCNU_09G006250 [Cocos nucifera]